MKVALFHTTLPTPTRKPGGVEIAVHRLANALERLSNTVTVYSSTSAPESRDYDHEQLLPDLPIVHKSRLARLLFLPAFLNRVSFSDHDVLHLHGDDWFFVSSDLPTVRTFHGSAWEEAQSADSWARCVEQYCVYLLEHLSDKVVTLSAAVGPQTSRIYNTACLVNNGVNLNRFHPGTKTDTPSILFVGTWKGRKRGRFLFEAFVDEVLPQIPEATLYMVVDECPDHSQVVQVDRPTDEELATLYRRAWVFAYPSIYEGFGIPYIEAMASGTAVLCSPNDGAEYVLDGGTYGSVCEDENFGLNLIRLLKNKTHRENLVARGLERARSFSWENVAEQHEKLYRRAIEKASGL